MAEILLINPIAAGLAGGILGAILIFLTTITAILGISKAANVLESTVWKKFGYEVNAFGSIWGAVLGFIYGFIIWYAFSIIYNTLI